MFGVGSISRRGNTLHRSFQQRLAVLRELLLRRFQFRHTSIEVGEQFFDFGDDADCFAHWSKQQIQV